MILNLHLVIPHSSHSVKITLYCVAIHYLAGTGFKASPIPPRALGSELYGTSPPCPSAPQSPWLLYLQSPPLLHIPVDGPLGVLSRLNCQRLSDFRFRLFGVWATVQKHAP